MRPGVQSQGDEKGLECAGVGRQQGTQPEAVARSKWEAISGRAVEMDTWAHREIFLDLLMKKEVGERETQGGFWFEELEYLPELRSGTWLRTGVLGPNTSWVTSEFSSIKWIIMYTLKHSCEN